MKREREFLELFRALKDCDGGIYGDEGLQIMLMGMAKEQFLHGWLGRTESSGGIIQVAQILFRALNDCDDGELLQSELILQAKTMLREHKRGKAKRCEIIPFAQIRARTAPEA